ncbi:MAG: CobW family GTP-binding protein [Actinomycetota bacterium]
MPKTDYWREELVDKRIPLTLIAGWHASGKSNLLERIIRGEVAGPAGAIVPTLSAFAEAGFVVKSDEEVVEQSAGCATCSIRLDLIRSIRHLVTRKLPPRRIVVELTGWSDASTAAQTILGDPYLARTVELDGLVTVVDAGALSVRAASGMDLWPAGEAAEQIALADVVVLNRMQDLTLQARMAATELIAEANRLAKVVFDDGKSFEPACLLGLGSYKDAAAQRVACLHQGCSSAASPEAIGHLVQVEGDLDADRFDEWLMSLDHAEDRRLLRVVGVVSVAGEECPVLCHRVGTFLDLRRGGSWQGGRSTRLFVCGRHLTADAIRSGLQACGNA